MPRYFNAPSSQILKRQRSRPSDWWAANPAVVESPKPTPARTTAPKTTPNKKTKRAPARRKSLPVAPSTLPSPHVEEPIAIAPKEVPTSLKRKRSRPSEWWTANAGSSTGEEKFVDVVGSQERPIKKNRSSLPIDGHTVDLQTKTDTILKKTPIKKKARLSLPIVLEPVEEPEPSSSALKRQRTRPSEWWAANPVTFETSPKNPAQIVSTQAAKPKKKTRFSLPATSTVPNSRDEGTNSSGAKRERRKPSEWWAASSAAIMDTPLRAGKNIEASEANSSSGSEDILGSAAVASKYSLRGGRLPQNKSTGEEEIVEVQTASSAFGRGRPAKGATRAVRPVDTSNDKNGPSAAKRGRKASKPQASQAESSASSIAKKGKKSLNSQSRTNTEKPFKAGKRSSEKASQTEQSKRRRKSEETEAEQNVQKTKRPRVSEVAQEEVQDEEVDEDEDEDELVPYQRLVPVIRKVHRHTIDAKWQPLPPECVELISQLLVDAQRPVVARQTDETKRAQANTALQWISRKLVRKISRGLPFPVGTHPQPEDEFNFEKIIDRNRILEGQLTAESDANKLLEENLAKEQEFLAAEKAALLELETNAKTESSRRKEAERKSHPLLQTEVAQGSDELGLSVINSRVLPSLDVSQDEKLQAVIREVEGHVDSLQSNIKQLEGIPDAISKAKAAVQVTLFDHLEETRYKDVLLGSG
ncbi:hypothetical protein HYFRA_00009165 [Hymenoscyphus fraxineus]|uniref:Kinetochore protein fta7 n=1 Tax=Hymenoscyphus fraxineus TaxID=746836 RepID=A0A9N9PI77_9HELO|nr:hypothetical protein HYFRA_00009165 [Hymenoscyphus fraxineus]